MLWIVTNNPSKSFFFFASLCSMCMYVFVSVGMFVYTCHDDTCVEIKDNLRSQCSSTTIRIPESSITFPVSHFTNHPTLLNFYNLNHYTKFPDITMFFYLHSLLYFLTKLTDVVWVWLIWPQTQYQGPCVAWLGDGRNLWVLTPGRSPQVTEKPTLETSLLVFTMLDLI